MSTVPDICDGCPERKTFLSRELGGFEQELICHVDGKVLESKLTECPHGKRVRITEDETCTQK